MLKMYKNTRFVHSGQDKLDFTVQNFTERRRVCYRLKRVSEKCDFKLRIKKRI